MSPKGTRAAIKATDSAKTTIALLGEAGREGIFTWRTGNYSAAVALDTLEGIFIKADGVAASAGCWVRQYVGLLNVKWFGAKGDSVANDKPAFDVAFAVAKANAPGLYLPKGIYNWAAADTTTIWDFSSVPYGFRMEGEGLSDSEIRFSGITTAGRIAWQWVNNAGGSLAPQYDKVFKGFGVRGFHDGPLLVIGKNDFSDTFETSFFERCGWINENAGGTQSIALRLNFLLGCQFTNSRAGCYASGTGTNYGTAVQARQLHFTTFTNFDYGNAARGWDFVDGISYANVAVGGGSENWHWHICFRAANASDNTFIGGRYSLWTIYGVLGGAGANNVIQFPKPNNDAGPLVFLDPVNFSGVQIKDRATVSTPAFPASGAAIANNTGRDVEVSYWGLTTLTAINKDGAGDGISATSGTFIFKAGGPLALSYTGTGTWRWRNVS